MNNIQKKTYIDKGETDSMEKKQCCINNQNCQLVCDFTNVSCNIASIFVIVSWWGWQLGSMQ